MQGKQDAHTIKLEKEKNYWWRMALHRGNALHEIVAKVDEQPKEWTAIDAASMHEIAETALKYEPPDD